MDLRYRYLLTIYSIYRCASVSTELNLFFKHRQLWKVVSTHSWMELYTVHTYIHTYILIEREHDKSNGKNGTCTHFVTFGYLCFALLRLASLLCYSLPLQHLLYTYQGHDTPT
jgi:Ni,Fe-hydrogenase I cytochrome b subunit